MKHENEKFFIDTNLESKIKFYTVEALVKNFINQKIGNLTRLGEPMNLKESNIYKYCNWFVGQIDPTTCKSVMGSTNKKCLFMVRENQIKYNINFFIEYHDRVCHQTLQVEQDYDG